MFCNICPRKCNIDRSLKNGFCGVGETLKVARAALHFYEEPCISGDNGSGTVFFSGCNLRCVYCQNGEISRGFGKEISVSRLSKIFIELQERGANNINLVTPDHFASKIITGLKSAKAQGLKIPVVYNTSGYCSVDTIKLLKDEIDIFLTDFKYFSAELAQKYSFAADYPDVVKKALKQMFLQTGKPMFDKNGMMKKGIIVRHLVLPGFSYDSKDIIDYVYSEYKHDVYISIMNQFTPINLEEYPELNRKVTDNEYNSVIDYALMLGVKNAYIQEGETANESFIPNFSDFKGV